MNEQNLHSSYNEYVCKLADRLFKLRKKAGFSQEKVASEAWIARLTYRKYEHAESNVDTPMNPQISTLIALANVFEIDLLELLDVDGERPHASDLEKTDDGDEAPALLDIDKGSARSANKAVGVPLNLEPEEFGALFGQRLQQLRWENDLSQEHAARKAGISSNSYYLLEKGESRPGTPANPHLKTLFGLANAFNVTLLELLEFDSPTAGIPRPTATPSPDPAGEEEWLALI